MRAKLNTYRVWYRCEYGLAFRIARAETQARALARMPKKVQDNHVETEPTEP